MILTLANTLSAIKPTKPKKRRVRSWKLGKLFSSGSALKLPQFSVPKHPLKVEQTDHTADLSTLDLLPPLTCELDIRSASISSSCCLLQTKQGHPLHGGAISTRLTRLKRMGVLI